MSAKVKSDTKSNQIYDVIVIGAGMAGLSAAVFTARANLKTLVIGDPNKGMFAMAVEVGNYLGCDGLSGPDILKKSIDQVKKYGAEFINGEVVNIKNLEKGKLFLVKCADAKEFEAKTVVIATGTTYKKAAISGEGSLVGKGVHYCVVCDGWFYKNKVVAVIGNGNFAAEEAIELLAYTKSVIIISNGKKFELSQEYMKELEKSNIVRKEDKIDELKGKNKLDAIILEDGSQIKADGVFVAIGTATALSFSDKLGLDKTKENLLVVDENKMTSVDGIYAAGGCIDGPVQVSKSVGNGCVAAISIIKRLKGLGTYVDHT